MVELLLAHGADVNAQNKGGNTPPLSIACYSLRYADMANLLIAHGADIEARDEHGDTPLLHALRRSYDRSYTPVMATLLVHGADPLASGHRGMTPLHWASIWADEEFALRLLWCGADVNSADVEGKTLLHCASEACEDAGLPTAGSLLENGADPNVADSSGITPLSCAIVSKSDEVVRLLVARGADVSVLVRKDRERAEKLCSGERLNQS
jgi:ankyrin repeat protein